MSVAKRVLPLETSYERDSFDEVMLPPLGYSPAGDLQRRVGEAALRGFYAPTEVRQTGVMRRAVIIAAGSVACWGLVFGTGALLLLR